MLTRTKWCGLVPLLRLPVELSIYYLIILQCNISTTLLFNCISWLLWIFCIELGFIECLTYWEIQDILRLRTIIWRCFNPSKRDRFLCPTELRYCPKAFWASLLKGSWEARGGTDAAIDWKMDDGFRSVEDEILISNVVGRCWKIERQNQLFIYEQT